MFCRSKILSSFGAFFKHTLKNLQNTVSTQLIKKVTNKHLLKCSINTINPNFATLCCWITPLWVQRRYCTWMPWIVCQVRILGKECVSRDGWSDWMVVLKKFHLSSVLLFSSHIPYAHCCFCTDSAVFGPGESAGFNPVHQQQSNTARTKQVQQRLLLFYVPASISNKI